LGDRRGDQRPEILFELDTPVELDLELFGEEGLVVPQRLVSVDVGKTPFDQDRAEVLVRPLHGAATTVVEELPERAVPFRLVEAGPDDLQLEHVQVEADRRRDLRSTPIGSCHLDRLGGLDLGGDRRRG
jgi:hypothetical protein